MADGRGIGKEETMGPDGRDAAKRDATRGQDRVFDFRGRRGLGLPDLALVITARLQGGPGGTVRAKEIPYETWTILRALGLDHLFLVVPEAGDGLN